MINLLFVPLLLLIFIGFSPKESGEPFSRRQDTALRGIACLLVVLHHLAQRIPEAAMPFTLFTYWGYLPVSFFFCVSGYGLLKSFCNKERYCQSVLLKRVPTLVFQYICYIAIYYGFSFLFTPHTFAYTLRSLFNGYPTVTDSWYVLLIFIFYFVFGCIGSFKKVKPIHMVISMFAVAVVWIIYCKVIDFPLHWYMTSLTFPFGMLIAYIESKKPIRATKAHPLAVVLCAVAFVGSFLIIYHKNFQPFIMHNISGILFVSLIYLCLLKSTVGNAVTRFLGKISFEIYLIHRIFIILFRSEYVYIQNDTVWCAAVILAAIAAGCILHFTLGKIKIDFAKLFQKKQTAQ